MLHALATYNLHTLQFGKYKLLTRTDPVIYRFHLLRGPVRYGLDQA